MIMWGCGGSVGCVVAVWGVVIVWGCGGGVGCSDSGDVVIVWGCGGGVACGVWWLHGCTWWQCGDVSGCALMDFCTSLTHLL